MAFSFRIYISKMGTPSQQENLKGRQLEHRIRVPVIIDEQVCNPEGGERGRREVERVQNLRCETRAE